MNTKSTPAHIKLDERNHVEKPFLEQLAGLDWNILDLEKDQKPADTGRSSFTEVVLEPRLRKQLQAINPWLQDDQIDDVVKQLTASFPALI
jgi:type I restriction enzyme R subunit